MFNPKIVAFCCEQSGMMAAAMAENLKLDLPANVEIRSVPCAGRLETVFLMEALEQGADAVLVFACHEENCQYLRGNIRAKSRLSYAQTRLERIGLEKERLELCNLATNSGVKFADVIRNKVEQLGKLGPNLFSRAATAASGGNPRS